MKCLPQLLPVCKQLLHDIEIQHFISYVYQGKIDGIAKTSKLQNIKKLMIQSNNICHLALLVYQTWPV